MAREKDLSSVRVRSETNEVKNLLANKTQGNLGGTAKIVPSSISDLAQVASAINALKPSALDAFSKTLSQLNLNNSTLESLAKASKALEVLKFKNSIIDGLASSRPLNTVSAFHDSTPHNSIFDQKAQNKIISSPSDIGQLIRDARKRKGLSQQQFADLAGVGRRFVSECEKGKPRLELGKVLQITSAAGIDIFAKKR
ncbi:MAG: helix-turn-helix transcriptional regulator [Aestuariivirga sp.]|nr:helix-turn-helix transcriptional regulator [Aestuariivirga sp.]